ncbi:hypothetical protein BDD12DRAFT_878275 [Trichophaea hybrida]|nr:hypothetical protein BDD12DRAFT_878275 [Trichophaea hybrida]
MISQLRPPRVPVHPKGYPSVAAYIASSPELAVFRKFCNLNARNLLNMQTELMMLESELEALDEQDADESERNDRLRSWQSVQNSTTPEDDLRKRVAYKVREKLQEYNNALVLYSQILAFEEPPKRIFEALNKWMNQDGHPARRPLIDIGDGFLGDLQDLLALTSAYRKRDPLSNFVRDHFGSFFKVVAPETEQISSPIFYYSEDRINRLSDFIALMLAARAVSDDEGKQGRDVWSHSSVRTILNPSHDVR